MQNDILKTILKNDVDQAEVYLSSSKSLKIDILNQKVESIEEVKDIGCGIRVIKDQKLGFAYTSEFEESLLENTINRAIENAKNAEKDKHLGLPKQEKIKNIELFDKNISEIPIQQKIEAALKIEETAYKTDKRVKKTEKVTYSDSASEVWIANSNGINAHYKSNHCGAIAQVIATHDGEMEYGFGLDFVKKWQDLDYSKIGKEAAKKACQLLGAKSIKSQKIPIILDPEIGTELLGVLSAPLSAEAVHKGKSLFAGKIGKSISSKFLTIIDNGKLENGISAAPFDDEGVPTQETKLVENGKLASYLFNTYNANKGKTKSTGNAARGSFKSIPSIGPTNFYICPGKKNTKSIVKSIKKGLYVTRVMGIHTANPISGDFSIGASGIMIEKGEKTYPVRGITIAGNLIDMLEGIEEVGSDLRFFANLGSPTLLISGMTISGH